MVMLVLVGCSAHDSLAEGATKLRVLPSPDAAPLQPPSVVGLQAVTAFHRLNAVHYGVVEVHGEWSHEARGVILAQQSEASPGEIRLTASMGTRAQAGDVVTLLGIASCDLGVHPVLSDCRGGPVILWTRNGH